MALDVVGVVVKLDGYFSKIEVHCRSLNFMGVM